MDIIVIGSCCSYGSLLFLLVIVFIGCCCYWLLLLLVVVVYWTVLFYGCYYEKSAVFLTFALIYSLFNNFGNLPSPIGEILPTPNSNFAKNEKKCHKILVD